MPILGDQVATGIIEKFLEASHKEENLARIVVDAFLSDAFIAPARGKRDYKLTSALSDIILAAKVNGEQICDGFAYPSVAHRGGLNLVLEGDCFADRMEICECMIFQIVDYLGYGIYGRIQVARSKGLFVGGLIDWQQILS